MQETCNTPYCQNPPTVDKVIESSFSMTSTSTKSRRVVRICAACAEQDKRMALVSSIASISLR